MLPARGWRFLDRRGHRLAFRLDTKLFDRFAGSPPTRPGWTAARVALLTVSALLMLVFLGALALAGWLLVSRGFDGPSLLMAVPVLLFAVVLRPRFGRRPAKNRILHRAEAPTLFTLIDQVATAAGTTPTDVVAVDESFNAATGRYGIRRRSVLYLGMPLWIILSPAQRVALLAHELGHQVNGDPTRGLLTQPALTTFRVLALTTGANRSLRQVVFGQTGAGLGFLAKFLLELALWLVSRVLLIIHVGLSAIGVRDRQRAEYLADRVSTEVAGTGATADLMDRMLLSESLGLSIVYLAETKPPAEWPELATARQKAKQAELPALRQLTRRETSLWDTHPPIGLRGAMVAAWPAQAPKVVLSDRASAQIDVELAGWYDAAHRLILGTRTFRGATSRGARSSVR